MTVSFDLVPSPSPLELTHPTLDSLFMTASG